MRFNPCGYIVDWTRAPYTKECRFFRDNDRIDTVRWVEAEPTALTLPFPSVILVSSNEQDQFRGSPIGEVYGARQKFSKKKVPKGLFDGHFCGTETDFAEGCLYVDEPPRVAYDAAGWPRCCPAPVTARGGAGGGGLARLEITNPVVPTPTCVGAPETTLGVTYNGTMTSGVTEQWWAVPAHSTPVTYCIHFTGLGSFPLPRADMFQGVCPSINGGPGGTTGTQFQVTIGPIFPRLYIKINRVLGTEPDAPYTIRVELGPC